MNTKLKSDPQKKKIQLLEVSISNPEESEIKIFFNVYKLLSSTPIKFQEPNKFNEIGFNLVNYRLS